MSDDSKNLDPFEIIVQRIRAVVREEIGAATGSKELLTPEELGEKLKVPLSWVYEQSRQGNLPTHRIGKYIRFDLREVIESQKNNRRPA